MRSSPFITAAKLVRKRPSLASLDRSNKTMECFSAMALSIGGENEMVSFELHNPKQSNRGSVMGGLNK